MKKINVLYLFVLVILGFTLLLNKDIDAKVSNKVEVTRIKGKTVAFIQTKDNKKENITIVKEGETKTEVRYDKTTKKYYVKNKEIIININENQNSSLTRKWINVKTTSGRIEIVGVSTSVAAFIISKKIGVRASTVARVIGKYISNNKKVWFSWKIVTSYDDKSLHQSRPKMKRTVHLYSGKNFNKKILTF